MDISLALSSDPPEPLVDDDSTCHACCTDYKGVLVAVVGPLGLEQLGCDDSTDLGNGGLKCEGECCPGGADESG